MTDAWTDHLSDYLDGELDQESHNGVVEHLEGCAQCRATLKGLRRIRDWASAYQPDAGNAREWRKLELRIRRRASLTVGLRVAALLLVGTGLATVVWYDSDRQGGEGMVGDTGMNPGAGSFASFEDTDYAVEIEALETLLRKRVKNLDPRTRQVLRESLESIEEMLARVREELVRNPQDDLLRELERRSNEQKLGLLRRALQRPQV